jgi:hypothetical protein
MRVVAAVIFLVLVAIVAFLISTNFVHEAMDTPAARVAAIAALLAFVSGVLGPFVQLMVGYEQAKVGAKAAEANRISAEATMLAAKTAGAREIAKLRMAWIENLRNKLCEYHSLLMNLESDDISPNPETKIAEDRKLSELGTHLDLLLNQQDALHKTLWDISDQIYKTPDQAERAGLDERLIRAGWAVLEAEWQKVTIEMQGGVFQSEARAS